MKTNEFLTMVIGESLHPRYKKYDLFLFMSIISYIYKLKHTNKALFNTIHTFLPYTKFSHININKIIQLLKIFCIIKWYANQVKNKHSNLSNRQNQSVQAFKDDITNLQKQVQSWNQ